MLIKICCMVFPKNKKIHLKSQQKLILVMEGSEQQGFRPACKLAEQVRSRLLERLLVAGLRDPMAGLEDLRGLL